MDTPQSIDKINNARVLIELNQVVKTYHTPAGAFTALKNVNLQVKAGEFAAVIGKSGSGKSTLINMVTGIDRPSLGEISIGGTPIHNLNENQMAAWRGRNLGVIFQFFQLLPTLTVVENVMLPMELCNVYPRSERLERAMHLLSLVGLSDQAYKFPSAVSGGQQQRAAIARALANDPEILVADEPTGSLDSKTADSIFMLFEDFVRQGRTILMVTHDRDLASRVSRVILIADGEITDEHISSAFPLLNKAEQVQLFSRLEPVNYAPGTTIIKKGDPATHFYILVKGHAEVVLTHPTGGEMVVGHLEAGQFFGEMGILEGGRRTATVRAASDSEVGVMQLDREAFVGMVENSQLTGNQIAALIRQRTIASSLSQFVPSPSNIQASIKEASSTEQDVERIDGLMSDLQDKWEIKIYQPDEVILKKDEPILGMYIISKGSVDVLTITEDNREVKAGTLRVSDFFGARNSILQTHKGSIVRAGNESQVEVIFINQSHLEKIAATEPGVEKSIVNMATTTMRLKRSEILKAKKDGA
jgi:ABC-type lipoprotein export system ATPase subunit/CRP-like cAMP-binding protein